MSRLLVACALGVAAVDLESDEVSLVDDEMFPPNEVASLGLPLLEAMRPVFGSTARAAEKQAEPPRRLVAVQTNMGIMPHLFFPEQSGKDYKPSPYLELLAPVRAEWLEATVAKVRAEAAAAAAPAPVHKLTLLRRMQRFAAAAAAVVGIHSFATAATVATVGGPIR